MSGRSLQFSALLLAALTSNACVRRSSADEPTPVVVVPKRLYTLDPLHPTAEALAFRGDTIIAVGTRAQAIEAAGPGALVDELPQAVVVPGLADAHVHLASLGRSLSVVWLTSATDEAKAVELIKAAGTSAYQGEWLLGGGWDQNDWATKPFPTRASLDAAFPTTPVFLTRIDGHAAWVNGAALRAAGITKLTKDPPGGRIVREPKSGEPTGVLVDEAMELVRAKMPPPSPDQLKRRLTLAIQKCLDEGLTSVHDAGMDVATFTVLQQWDMLGLLPLRVYAMALGTGRDGDEYLGRGPFTGRMLTMRAVKLVFDGALGSRGASLFKPYADEPSQSGLVVMAPPELLARARAFADRGFQVAVHAIGDHANAMTLEVLAQLPKGRHRVEHAQLLREVDVPRFAKDELIASFQPTHATSDMPWAAARVGEERLKFAYAWRSVLDTGAHVAFGSDFPIEEVSPLLGLYAARTRQDAKGEPDGGWHPEQRVSGLEALQGFTTGAAYASFAEERRGHLTVGTDADFTALSVDPVEGPAAELLQAKVLMTVVAGKDVYRAVK